MYYDHQGAKEADVPGTSCLIKCSSNHPSNNSVDPIIVTMAIPGSRHFILCPCIVEIFGIKDDHEGNSLAYSIDTANKSNLTFISSLSIS